jgi:hypothetical protein
MRPSSRSPQTPADAANAEAIADDDSACEDAELSVF